jgi:hypothetical protein
MHASIILIMVLGGIHVALLNADCRHVLGPIIQNIQQAAGTTTSSMFDVIAAAVAVAAVSATVSTTATMSTSTQTEFPRALIESLTAVQDKYYVYDDFNMSRPDIRSVVKEQGPRASTWKLTWGKRITDYALQEIMLLEALEGHPILRTTNISDATIIIIPIPVAALISYGHPHDTRRALDALYSQQLFRQHPSKHVILSLNEFTFYPWKVNNFITESGWTPQDYYRTSISKITVVMDIDYPLWYAATRSGLVNKGPHGWAAGLLERHRPITDYTWSYSLAAAAADPTYSFREASWTNFQNKSLVFFYHTTPDTSLNNSTQFRHAPVLANGTLTQPSSVGFGLPFDKWLQHTADAKFCPTIRGDNPMSRALWRSIRVGCIPIVISNMWQYYSPLYRSQLTFEDFCIVIDENEFLADPAGTLNGAVASMTEEMLRHKVDALATVQRMLVPDHPKGSLLVNAFVKETIASWDPGYTNFTFPVRRRR